MHEQNGYLILEHLSNIELYYTSPEFIEGEKIILQGEEFHHAINVMRNSIKDLIHITDGQGTIYKAEIIKMTKSNLSAIVKDKFQYENRTANIWFCIPLLKNQDRLKFAIEKSVELGISNFVLFTSKYTISKKINTEKLLRTALVAMKQSLRAFLPKIISASFNEILKFPSTKIIFDQKAELFFDGNVDTKKPVYFLFGPEGGFDKSEINAVSNDGKFNLSSNRLRSETAIIKCASSLILL